MSDLSISILTIFHQIYIREDIVIYLLRTLSTLLLDFNKVEAYNYALSAESNLICISCVSVSSFIHGVTHRNGWFLCVLHLPVKPGVIQILEYTNRVCEKKSTFM